MWFLHGALKQVHTNWTHFLTSLPWGPGSRFPILGPVPLCGVTVLLSRSVRKQKGFGLRKMTWEALPGSVPLDCVGLISLLDDERREQ